ncbi:MAG: PIN domain-containing protein [Nitrosopumilaceae archaeon]
MVTRVYLDTWYLTSLVATKSSERADAKSLLSKMKYGYEIVVPQVALGEVFAVIVKKYTDPNEINNKLSKLCDDLFSVVNPKTCLSPISNEVLNCAVELQKKDDQIKNTDLMIIAHALTDPRSSRLLTSDRKMLDSSAIPEMELRLRTEGKREIELRVTDGLGH